MSTSSAPKPGEPSGRFARFGQWLGAHELDDLERHRVFHIGLISAGMIGMILLASPLFALVQLISSDLAQVVTTLVATSGMLSVALVCLMMVRRGAVDAAGTLLTAALSVTILGSMAATGDFVTIPIFLTLSILVASLVARPVAVVITTVVLAATLMGVVLAVTPPENPEQWSRLIYNEALLVCSGFLGFLTTSSHARALGALDQARGAAVRASVSKSEYLAALSHEMRTPLTTVIGYSELILEDADAHELVDEVAEDIGLICSAAQHLRSMLDDVLDLSKIEAGRMDTNLEDVAPRAFFDALEKSAEHLASKQTNTFTMELGELPERVVTDPTKLRQILLNLLSNAAKFTRDGAITLGARRDGAELVLFVRDTGIGMSEAQLARVFDAYTQATDTTQRDFGGTGLGLALCRELSRLLGGRIEVESTLGKGSTFTVTLPLDH